MKSLNFVMMTDEAMKQTAGGNKGKMPCDDDRDGEYVNAIKDTNPYCTCTTYFNLYANMAV